MRTVGPYMGEPMPLREIKRIVPWFRVRRVSSNLVVAVKRRSRRSRSQAHQRKVCKERGW